MLKRWLTAGASAFALSLATNAMAETYGDASGTTIHGFAPVVGCSPNGSCAGPVSATNPLPITGTLSASLSGFTPGGAYAPPLSVSTTSANVALPSGTVIVVYNTGASAAYVKLGGSGVVATTANDVIPAGGWMAFTVGANAYLGAVTASGSTSLNLSGGSGLPTGAGGGGPGGGGALSQGAAAAASGAWPTYLTVGGSAMSSGNGLFVNPATGATFPVSGSVSLTGTSSVAVTSEVGVGATGAAVPVAAQFAGMSVGGALTGMTGTANGLKVDGSAVTQPISGTVGVSSLPALPAGGNAIGSITNTAFSIAGTLPAFAATPTFNIGTAPSLTIGALPPLATGSNVIGAVTQSGGWSVGVTSEVGVGATGAAVPAAAQFAGMNVGGNLTGMTGTANGLKVDGSAVTQPVSLVSLPALAAGSNAIGSVGVNNQPVGAANIATSQAAPTTSATQIVAARTGAAGAGRVAATVFNNGSTTVYVGSASVTTATGLPLSPGSSLTLNTTAALYGVTASGAGAVSALETY